MFGTHLAIVRLTCRDLFDHLINLQQVVDVEGNRHSGWSLFAQLSEVTTAGTLYYEPSLLSFLWDEANAVHTEAVMAG